MADAERLYRQVLALDPGHPEALGLLGMLAGQAGQPRVAVDLFQRALKRDPRNADLHHNLGETWRHLGENRLALQCFERAAELNPDHIEAHRSGADAALAEATRCETARRWADAAELKRMAVALLIGAGQRLRDAGDMPGSSEALRRATELDPKHAAAWAQYGQTLAEFMPSQAIPALRRAIELDPHNGSAYSMLRVALLWLYRREEAQAVSDAAHAAVPSTFEAPPRMDMLELFPLYVGGDMAKIFAVHRAWGDAAIAREKATPPAFKNDRDPGRRLRIGYLSPNLRTHSISFFFEPLLRAHDRACFDAVCYSAVRALAEDDATIRLRALTSTWRAVPATMDDDALRRQIAADKIDILIDLAGHMGNSRVRVFAVKPAPVTVTWLGYPATTGLTTVDWRITDAIADPPGAETFHTEKLIRLDGGFLCYGPSSDAPAVSLPPATRRGFVTFGSFNNQLKINNAVIATWAQILKAVPDARLLIKSSLLTDDGVVDRLRDGFLAAGIEPGRIDLRDWTPTIRDHLGAYAEVDIALDPFPYNGTTTTCEALWMGVPVVTLIGDRHSARVGFDLLTRVGLDQFAAADTDAYVRIATALAADHAALAKLRTELRKRVKVSPLCDATRFAREFESTMRSAWWQWCESGR